MQRLIKHSLILILMAAAITACGRKEVQGTGQEKQEVRNVAQFTGINVNGNYKILGSTGSPQKVVIASNANLLPFIETNVSDSVLIVQDQKKMVLHPTLDQRIWFNTTKFNSVTLNGSSVFQFQHLKTDNLDIHLSGAHQLLLTGTAGNLNIVVNGSSDIDARDFVVQNVTVEINGSSTVYINPAKKLKITINGDGQVVYFSQSPQIEQLINGSGKVISNFKASGT